MHHLAVADPDLEWGDGNKHEIYVTASSGHFFQINDNDACTNYGPSPVNSINQWDLSSWHHLHSQTVMGYPCHKKKFSRMIFHSCSNSTESLFILMPWWYAVHCISINRRGHTFITTYLLTKRLFCITRMLISIVSRRISLCDLILTLLALVFHKR